MKTRARCACHIKLHHYPVFDTSRLPRNDHKTLTDIMRIGILTAGGDCPGLNAVIRAVVRSALADNVEVLGIRNGYLGLFENEVEPLTRASVNGTRRI